MSDASLMSTTPAKAGAQLGDGANEARHVVI
jgi:hypothetical protein